ncbi:uncharacterized protein [Diabrotica undecimpunctata]|uniref:uncharacterized protein n=1 Tax=Diabrotica undecimpunctata TaxID=50387 RepID=UPI003B638AE3
MATIINEMVQENIDEPFKIIDVELLEQNNSCHNCHKLLNVIPIYGLQQEDDTIKEVCGRCLHITEKHKGAKWRQISYEKIAQHMTFPCCYKMEGCNSVLTWDTVLDHEVGCPKAFLVCPVNDNGVYKGLNCLWKGNTAELQKHIEDEHGELIINPPFLEELPKQNQIYFTYVNKKIVMIVILKESDNNYFSCVFFNGSDVETQYYKYQVELIDESKTSSIILRKYRLEPYGNFLAILADKKKLLDINLEVVKPMINQQGKIFSARFGLAMKNKRDVNQIAKDNNVTSTKISKTVPSNMKNHVPDENLLAELECPVCNEYMVPPIYICGNGHSLCNECIEKVQSCPNCRSSLASKTRNFTVEKLTTKVNYPCRNRDIGCGFSTTSDNIRDHEKNCDLADTLCIFKCGEKFKRTSLLGHINTAHKEGVIQLNVVNTLNILHKKETTLVVSAFGEMFRLSIKTIQSAAGSAEFIFKLNVQHMDEVNQHSVYRYKFDFIDQSDEGRNTTIMSTTQPISEKPLKLNHVTVPYHVIKAASKENKLYYRLNMYSGKRKRMSNV